MYRVLVVDDEVLIRKRIRYGFEWEGMGFCVSGEAENGQNALTLLETGKYELAIVDIAMPGMDGIELVRQIRAKGLETEIIFLTGHSEFEYARVALQERVFEYILKPLNETEFIAAIGKLYKKIERQKLLQNRQVTMEAVQRNQKMLKSIYQSSVTAAAAVWLRHFGEGMKLRLVIVQIRNFYGQPDGFLKLAQELRALITAEGIGEGEICFDMSEGIFFLLINEEGISGKDQWIHFMKRLVDFISGKVSRRVNIGISGTVCDNQNLHHAYRQGIRAVRNCLIYHNHGNIFEDIERKSANKYILPVDQIHSLRLAVETADQELADQTLQHVFGEMSDREIEYQEVLRIGEQMITILSEITAKLKLDIREIMGEHYTVEAAYCYMETYEEIPLWFQMITAVIIKQQMEKQSKKLKDEVAVLAKTYIKTHYMEQELSVKTLANRLFVSDTYLSASFKKSMGMSLVQYITKCRLEKARELLNGAEGEVNKVAAMVGYSDEYYFSRCFKKYFGMSPFYVKRRYLSEID